MAYGEDTLWVFDVNFLAGDECVGNCNKVNYYYRVRQGSAMQTRTADSKVKHMQSMETMLGVYERMLLDRGDILTEAQRKHLRKRIDWSVQNVLFDSLIATSYNEQRELFNRVAHRQHAVNWGRLSIRFGMKNFIVNLIGLPLKYRLYYSFLARLFSMIK